MDEYDREFGGDNQDSGNNWISIAISIGIVVGMLFFFRNSGKYEGQTAEEWFNDYDELYSCVETYANSTDYEDLANIKSCL